MATVDSFQPSKEANRNNEKHDHTNGYHDLQTEEPTSTDSGFDSQFDSLKNNNKLFC